MKNSLNIKRRRPLSTTAATTAAAALSLAGCNMFAPPANPLAREAERRVNALPPLDPVDLERLRASAAATRPESKATVPVVSSSASVVSSAPAAATPGALSPAAAGDTAKPPASATAGGSQEKPAGSAPVILASATPAAVTPSSTPSVAPAAAGNTGTGIYAAPGSLLLRPGPGADITPESTSSSASPVPLSVPPMSGVVVAPLSSDTTVPTAVIAPFTPPATPVASAMGSMSAGLSLVPAPSSDSTAAPASAEPSVDQAIDVLRQNIDEHPTLNTVLALALLNDDKASQDAIKKLSDPDQKVASDLLAALQAMKGKSAAPTLAARTAPLFDAAKAWQVDADLTLPRLVLATRVDSFGVFTPTSNTFTQGQRHTVIIYCEVANFTSKKGDDGWYTTKLSQQETLFTEDGLLVWRPNAEDVEDRSLNQRHDFYLVKKLTIPETLAAGKYTLRMNVTDLGANKHKMVEMPIEIVTK